MSKRRTELQREVAEALISSKAVNFEGVGTVLAKYGARAALAGDAIGVVINFRVMDICIPVDWLNFVDRLEIDRAIAGVQKG
jgi:hypothetical protein